MASKGGIRNTVRFRWIVKNAPVMQRELFGRTFLQGLLKLKVDQVYCLQSNAQEKSYDVTFITAGVMEDVLVTCRERAGERHFSSFEIVSLDRPNFRLITLHIYNPHVTKEGEEARFLSSYGEVFAGSRRLMDSCGYWTGRTQFQVLLKEDPGGFDGLAHPPAFFSIAADRGFLFYSRQPPFCKRCRKQGHTEGACGFIRCRICTAYGHEAKDCPHIGACNICGKAGHFYRDCPERKRTYAEAAGRGPGGGEVASSSSGNVQRPIAVVEEEGQWVMEEAHAEAAGRGPGGGEVASSGSGNVQRPIAVVEEEEQRVTEDVFALTEQDTFYDCSQEEAASGSKPKENKAGTAKRSAAKKIRKASMGLGGNCKEGGRDRGSKRGREEEGGRNVPKERR